MRKYFITTILLVITASFVYSQASNSVADVLNKLVLTTNSEGDIYVVYGDDAAPQDKFGAFMVAHILPILNENFGYDFYMKKVSEIQNPENHNLILIGGPCANTLSEKITELQGYNCNDWKFLPGQSIVKVFQNGEKLAVLVAGTNYLDTEKMSEAIQRYKKSERLKSSDEVTFETAPTSNCGNDICETKETDENCPKDCYGEESISLTPGILVNTFNMDGDYLVFAGRDSFDSTDSYIYLYQFSTKEITKIDIGYWPSISGDNVVYQGREKVYNDLIQKDVERDSINLYNLKTKNIKVIHHAVLKDSHPNLPLIFKDAVVYKVEFEGFKPSIVYKYDINSRTETELFRTEYLTVLDSFNGRYISFSGPKYCKPEYCARQIQETSPGNFVEIPAEEGDLDVWLYDINNNDKKKITSDKERQGFSVINGNLIAWVDGRNLAEGNMDIYLYDIDTGTENKLDLGYHEIGGFSSIAFKGNKILWTDSRNLNPDVYMYDTQDKIQTRITLNSKSQGDAKINDHRIVWIDHRNGNLNNFKQDLYMYEFS